MSHLFINNPLIFIYKIRYSYISKVYCFHSKFNIYLRMEGASTRGLLMTSQHIEALFIICSYCNQEPNYSTITKMDVISKKTVCISISCDTPHQ